MVKTVKKVQYLKGEIVPSDARLALKLITSHQVYEMAMNFDEFKQFDTSVQVSRGLYFLLSFWYILTRVCTGYYQFVCFSLIG